MYCSKPWTDLELGPDWAATCCRAWLSPEAYLHHSDQNDLWRIWNAEPLQRLRDAVAGDNERYCRKCPWLLSRTRPTDELGSADAVMSRGPKSLADCVDRTCNLHCWSCRRQAEDTPADHVQRARKLSCALAEFGPTLELFSTNQVGDPFASRVSRAALRSPSLGISPAKLRICTNGLLMPATWPDLPEQVRERLYAVHISIDAANPETYELLRRGATWEGLLAALNFLAMLRHTGQPEILLYQFVVQSRNFREMPAFMDLARHGRATGVVFTHLRRWALSRAEFVQRSLANPDHPDAAAFEGVLKHPNLLDPLVQWRHLHPAVAQSIWQEGSSRP